MINGKGLRGSKERVRKEDGIRDPHLGQKPTMRQEMTNSSQLYHESWPTPWAYGQESHRNPLPCLKMRSTKILAYAYYHANITTKVQRLSFEYFTSRGCSTNRDEEVNWVTTIPNSLPLYPICCLGPARVTPLLVKYLKLRCCTFVQPKSAVVAPGGPMNPIRPRPNGWKGGRPVWANPSATNDWRIRLHQATGVQDEVSAIPRRQKRLDDNSAFMKYHGDIAKFLLEMENLNICARVTRNASREMMEDQLPEHA